MGSDDAARSGSAFHAYMRGFIVGHEPAIADIAAEFFVDADDLEVACAMGRRQWAQLMDYFPGPQVEQKIGAEWTGRLATEGTPDLFSLRPEYETIYALDWKSGFRQDVDHSPQMMMYSAVLLENHPWAKKVVFCVVNVRAGTADWETYDRECIEQWLGNTIRRLQQTDRYSPGTHCGYCERGHECEAKTLVLAQSAAMVLADVNAQLPVEPQERADFLGRLKDARALASKVCDELGDLIKAEVRAAGGAMRLSDGRELIIKEIEKKSIAFREGELILREALGGGLAECVRVSKTAVEKAVKANAPSRFKGKAWQEVLENLDGAGALASKFEERLETRRVPLAIAE